MASADQFAPLPSPHTVVYKTVGDVEIDADIYLPHADKARRNGKGFPLIIDIHGGAFMLGSSGMVNRDQIADCLSRGWIVVVPNHRLCPQVNLLEGPMADCRDLLAWIQDGGVEEKVGDGLVVDKDCIFGFGTSSGGTLALSLGFGVPKPVAGILDFYGPCDFAHPSWTQEIEVVKARLPLDRLTDEFLNRVYEGPVPIRGGMSLEGQGPAGPPDFSDPRTAFAQSRIAFGKVMQSIFPSEEWGLVDPLLNVKSAAERTAEGGKPFPPTFIVHGQADDMVPIELSRSLFQVLKQAGAGGEKGCDMVEVPGEPHTFAGRMKVGSRTWELQRKGFDFLESLIDG